MKLDRVGAGGGSNLRKTRVRVSRAELAALLLDLARVDPDACREILDEAEAMIAARKRKRRALR